MSADDICAFHRVERTRTHARAQNIIMQRRAVIMTIIVVIIVIIKVMSYTHVMRVRSRENNYEKKKISNDLRWIPDVASCVGELYFRHERPSAAATLLLCTYVPTSYIVITFQFFDPVQVMGKYRFGDLKFFTNASQADVLSPPFFPERTCELTVF